MDKKVKEILLDCMKFGETIGVDTPTAIARCIKAMEGEFLKKKEEIKKARLEIKNIKEKVALAKNALTHFWIMETDKRKSRSL